MREEGEEEEKPVLKVILWPEPFALKHTPDEQKVTRDFPFSEEGLDEIYEWILGEGRSLVRLPECKKEGITAFLFSSQTHLYNKRIYPLLTLCFYFIIVL